MSTIVKVLSNTQIEVGGTVYKWRVRKDGSIKVESGLGTVRKEVKAALALYLESVVPTPAAANLSAPETDLSVMETGAFKAIVKNILDNSDGDFGFYDQARLSQTGKPSEKTWHDVMVALQSQGLLNFNTNDFNVKLTQKGVDFALQADIISKREHLLMFSKL